MHLPGNFCTGRDLTGSVVFPLKTDKKMACLAQNELVEEGNKKYRRNILENVDNILGCIKIMEHRGMKNYLTGMWGMLVEPLGILPVRTGGTGTGNWGRILWERKEGGGGCPGPPSKLTGGEGFGDTPPPFWSFCRETKMENKS